LLQVQVRWVGESLTASSTLPWSVAYFRTLPFGRRTRKIVEQQSIQKSSATIAPPRCWCLD